MNEYLCPSCYVRLEREQYKLVDSKNISNENINIFRGFCKHCRQPFFYFNSEMFDVSVFWSSEHEEVLFNKLNKKKNRSINILYLPNMIEAEETIKKYRRIPTKETNIVYTVKDCLQLVDKFDLRNKNKIILIDDKIIDSRLDETFPCILAERNLIFAASYFSESNIYSNEDNLFYKEKIKRL